MTVLIHSRNTPASNRLDHAIKSSDKEDQTDNDMKKPAVHSPEYNVATSIEVTLDDLGGRSDALGG
jgi:hypothetical protein